LASGPRLSAAKCRAEFRDGYATGKRRKPFVAGATKEIMRSFARANGIDLAESGHRRRERGWRLQQERGAAA
jgi:hypothetical protein